MKTILITGGAGFIGSAFARYVFDKYPDYKIIIVDQLTYAASIENLPVPIWKENDDKFEFWYGDVTNGELIDTLVSRSDFVVHFAAETHVARSIYDNMQFTKTDVLGTQVVCNAITKYRDRIERFLHISTSEVYGSALTENMDENHPLNPTTPYAGAKTGADRIVYSYWMTYQIPVVIIRPFNNYGPRQHLEKLIPRFITSTLLDEKLKIHGTGNAARDFVYVDDTCEALDSILHASKEKVLGEVFNIGSGEHRTVLSVANDIINLMRPGINKEKFVNIGDRFGQVMRHTASILKIRKVFGWKPKTDWTEGLKKTAEWYENNKQWWKKQLWMREVPIVGKDGKRELY